MSEFISGDGKASVSVQGVSSGSRFNETSVTITWDVQTATPTRAYWKVTKLSHGAQTAYAWFRPSGVANTIETRYNFYNYTTKVDITDEQIIEVATPSSKNGSAIGYIGVSVKDSIVGSDASFKLSFCVETDGGSDTIVGQPSVVWKGDNPLIVKSGALLSFEFSNLTGETCYLTAKINGSDVSMGIENDIFSSKTGQKQMSIGESYVNNIVSAIGNATSAVCYFYLHILDSGGNEISNSSYCTANFSLYENGSGSGSNTDSPGGDVNNNPRTRFDTTTTGISLTITDGVNASKAITGKSNVTATGNVSSLFSLDITYKWYVYINGKTASDEPELILISAQATTVKSGASCTFYIQPTNLTQPGKYQIVMRFTDAQNYWAESSVSFDVVEDTTPVVTKFNAERTGNTNENAHVVAYGTWPGYKASKYTGNTYPAKLYVREYSKENSTVITISTTSIVHDSSTNAFSINFTTASNSFNTNKDYELWLEFIYYDLSGAEKSVTTGHIRIARVGAFMRWDKERKSIGFGCIPRHDNSIEIGQGYHLWLHLDEGDIGKDIEINSNGGSGGGEVDSVPNIEVNPSPVNTEDGENATFLVTAQGATTYKWQYSTDNVTFQNCTNEENDGNSITIEPSDAFYKDGNYFRCVCSNSIGDTISNSAKLSLGLTYTTIECDPDETSNLPIGETVDITAHLYHNKILVDSDCTFQWRYKADANASWGNISGATTNKYTTTVSTEGTMQYYCVVKYNNDDYRTDEVTCTWSSSSGPQETPSISGISADNTVVDFAGIIKLTAENPQNCTSFKWYVRKPGGDSNKLIENETAATIDFSDTTIAGDYLFTCQPMNGSTPGSSIVDYCVTVRPAQESALAWKTLPGSGDGNTKNIYFFYNKGYEIVVETNKENVKYRWTKWINGSESNIGNTTNKCTIESMTQSDEMYRCHASLGDESIYAEFHIHPIYIETQPANATITVGGNTTLTITLNNINSDVVYGWYEGDTYITNSNKPSVTVDSAGTYKCKLILNGETLWSEGATVTVQQAMTVQAKCESNGADGLILSAVVSNNTSDFITYRWEHTVDEKTWNFDNVSTGQEMNLDTQQIDIALTNGYKYRCVVGCNGQVATSNTIDITEAYNNIQGKKIEITIYVNENVSTTQGDLYVNSGDDVQLVASLTNISDDDIESKYWSRKEQNSSDSPSMIPGATNKTYSFEADQYNANNKRYYFNIIFKDGTSISQVAYPVFKLNPTQAIKVTIDPNTYYVEKGQTVTLTATTDLGNTGYYPDVTYNWYRKGSSNPVKTETKSNSVSGGYWYRSTYTLLNIQNGGTYYCTVSCDGRNGTSNEVTINIDSASVSVSQTVTPTIGNNAKFIATVTPSGYTPQSYAWYLVDGSNTTLLTSTTNELTITVTSDNIDKQVKCEITKNTGIVIASDNVSIRVADTDITKTGTVTLSKTVPSTGYAEIQIPIICNRVTSISSASIVSYTSNPGYVVLAKKRSSDDTDKGTVDTNTEMPWYLSVNSQCTVSNNIIYLHAFVYNGNASDATANIITEYSVTYSGA